MASPAAAAPPSSSPKNEPLSSPHASLAGAGCSTLLSPSSSSSPARDRSLSPLLLPAPPPSFVSAPPPYAPSSRRIVVPCWNHEETIALVDAYRKKWYALRRGNLRANHWQEVADGVNRRCAASGSSSTKTSVQCRHKVEKLRKRYRNERQKSIQRDPSNPPSSTWVYFRKMEGMERGAPSSDGGSTTTAVMTANARRLFPIQPPSSDEDEEKEEDEEEEEDDSHLPPLGLRRLIADGGSAAATGSSRGLRFTVPKAVRSKSTSHVVKPRNPTTSLFRGYEGARPAMEEMRRKLKKRRRSKERESEAVSEMVSALRALGDGFLRMEQRKMEMARELEKVRMEMELKRSELILDSQRRIVDAFVKGFLGRKKAKISSED